MEKRLPETTYVILPYVLQHGKYQGDEVILLRLSTNSADNLFNIRKN